MVRIVVVEVIVVAVEVEVKVEGVLEIAEEVTVIALKGDQGEIVDDHFVVDEVAK